MKNLGIILIIIGALLLVLGAFVWTDMVDYNSYTWGNVILIIVGLVSHIIINKKHV